MQKLHRIPIMVNGNGQTTVTISRNFGFIYLDTAGYAVKAYAGRFVSPDTLLWDTKGGGRFTFPLELLPSNDYEITLAWTGTGSAIIGVYLSETNLNINQPDIQAFGGSTVALVSDAVGLVRGTQLPATLDGAGNLKVGLQAALPAGTNVIGHVIIDSLPSVVIASLPNITVQSLPPLPAGTNNIGDVDVVTLPAVTMATAELKPATTPTVLNTTMTAANTEYTVVLPAGTRKFTLSIQTGDVDYRIAWTTGKVATPTAPYFVLPAGSAYNEDEIYSAATKTLYIACGVAGKVAQVIAWT